MISINNNIHFTSNQISKKGKDNKTDIPEGFKVYDESNPDEYFDYLKEDNSFTATQKRADKEDKIAKRNILLGALVALGTISAPIVGTSYMEHRNNELNGVPMSGIYDSMTKEDSTIIENANELAQGGKRSDVLESQEFMKLLDYSKIQGFTKSTRKAIECMSKSMFLPVDMNAPDAPEQILKMVKDAQSSIDHLVEVEKKYPNKSYSQMCAEYAINNITDEEILDGVDMSELAYYQKDLTMVKAMINMTRDDIKRDDLDAVKKYDKEVKDAQSFVDNIVQRYKTRARVSGNYNGDEVLSKGELSTLLDYKVLKGLPDEIKLGIISKALKSYKPISLRYATDDEQVKLSEKKVQESRDKAQAIMNQWAHKAQKQFWHISHPNEIRTGGIERTSY